MPFRSTLFVLLAMAAPVFAQETPGKLLEQSKANWHRLCHRDARVSAVPSPGR